jgi:hypothetical protein
MSQFTLGLWSLLDMLRIYANEYVKLGRRIELLTSIFRLIERAETPDQARPMTDKEKTRLVEVLGTMHELCEKTELTTAAEVVKHAITDPPQTAREMEALLRPIDAELKKRLFLFVPAHRARYYEHNEAFTLELDAAFPKGCDELAHAGNCYATGEYTASVFHSMRATEIALRAVAVKTNIPIKKGTWEQADWHTLIELIENHVKTLRGQAKTAAIEDEIKFYADAASQFGHLKDAFRKYVAHARDSYNEQSAIDVLHRATGLIKSLSAKVSE